MNEVLKFQYTLSLKLIILCTLFFLPCTAVLVHKAINNDAGLILNRIIEFSAKEASLFYWALSALGVAFVLLGIYGAFNALLSKTENLVIDARSVFIPKVGFSKEKTVMFEDIKNVNSQNVSGTIIFTLVTEEGKAAINNRNFKNKKEFEAAMDTLLKRIHANNTRQNQ